MNKELPNGCVDACIGCRHRSMTDVESYNQKMNYLKRILQPYAESIQAIVHVDNHARWGYRDKVSLNTSFLSGNWQFGLMRRDEFISIPKCPIHSQRIINIIELLTTALPPYAFFPMHYFVLSGAQLTLVLKTKKYPSIDWLNEGIRKSLEDIGIEGLWLHLNPSAGRRMFEKNGWHLVMGKFNSIDETGLLYGPAAFQQLIQVLYHDAIMNAFIFFNLKKSSLVFDLYCGMGATLRLWTEANSKVVGVELNGNAIDCANQNAPNAIVLRGKCSERIPQMDKIMSDFKRNDLFVFANPDRRGLEPEILKWIVDKVRPFRFAYLSCSAGTLRRDLDTLTLNGFVIKQLIPYDFFPQTHHIECLTLLECSN